MIGKPEWFTYRIFGWGLRPKTKEGWIYVIVGVALAALISLLPLEAGTKAKVIGAYIALIIIDVLHIMVRMDKMHDERERLHQLIIERNSSFAAVAAIAGVLLYQSFAHASFDVSLLVVLGAMVIAKSATYLYAVKRL